MDSSAFISTYLGQLPKSRLLARVVESLCAGPDRLPVIHPTVELNNKFFLRSRPLRQPAGHRLGRPTGLLAPQSRVGINVGSAMRWNPTGNRRGGQKKHSDGHKGKRIAG